MLVEKSNATRAEREWLSKALRMASDRWRKDVVVLKCLRKPDWNSWIILLLQRKWLSWLKIMRSRIFDRKGGRVMGRSEVKEVGLGVLGRGRTVECFQAEGKVPLVRQWFKIKRRGLRHAGAESKSIRPEKSYGHEEVSLMDFSMLYKSVMFIGENWNWFWIIGADRRKKFIREDEQEEEGRELMKKLLVWHHLIEQSFSFQNLLQITVRWFLMKLWAIKVRIPV